MERDGQTQRTPKFGVCAVCGKQTVGNYGRQKSTCSEDCKRILLKDRLKTWKSADLIHDIVRQYLALTQYPQIIDKQSIYAHIRKENLLGHPANHGDKIQVHLALVENGYINGARKNTVVKVNGHVSNLLIQCKGVSHA